MFRDFNDPLYKKFRQQVRKRDNHKCQWPNCNQTKKLQVHHIKRWVDSIDLRFNINNAITLCKFHHDLIRGNEIAYEGAFFKIITDNSNKLK
jgi:predicted restriction endonuclease